MKRFRLSIPKVPPRYGYMKGDPEKEVFRIVAWGDEQSEVKWPNGHFSCIVNKWIIPVEDKS